MHSIGKFIGLLLDAGMNPIVMSEEDCRKDKVQEEGAWMCCESIRLPDDMQPVNMVVQLTMTGDWMVDIIHPGDLLTAKFANTATDGQIVVFALNNQIRVGAYFEKNNRRWMLPRNRKYKPLEITDELDFYIFARVTDFTKSGPQMKYSECVELLGDIDEPATPRHLPSAELQEQTIRRIAPMIKVSRHWYAVYRAMVDAECSMVTKGDYRAFRELLLRVLPDHEHLPLEQELSRMDVQSFTKPVKQWKRYDSPSPKNFQRYLSVAISTFTFLDAPQHLFPD